MKLLDLSPVAVRVAQTAPVPGLSSSTRSGWVHGNQALALCRVDPQSTCLDVWEGLSLSAVSPAAGMRHRADLAVAQLREMGSDWKGDWVVAVSASWPKEVLQIFLGVAQECGISVQGLFPRALAAAALSLPDQVSVQVWEWGWRQLQVCDVRCTSGVWQIRGMRSVPELGVMSMFRRESRLAAEWMLERHRVDPLYSGSTEQELFNSWWAWHSGVKEGWQVEAGDTRMDLAEEADTLSACHRPVLEEHGLADESLRVGPRPLCHLIGNGNLHPEAEDFSPALEGLDLPPGKGPRWRDRLHVEPPAPDRSRKLPTHVVVNGIAEPMPAGVKARTGETLTLPDGREALAVFVPES